MRARSVLTVVALSATVLMGCASQPDGETGDCISLLKFGDRTYVWTPAGNEYVTPGKEVGTATPEPPCVDSDLTLRNQERTAYAFPHVPPEEAFVVADIHGKHGMVYRSEAPPASGWDPDFAKWLQRAGALQQQDGSTR